MLAQRRSAAEHDTSTQKPRFSGTAWMQKGSTTRPRCALSPAAPRRSPKLLFGRYTRTSARRHRDYECSEHCSGLLAVSASAHACVAHALSHDMAGWVNSDKIKRSGERQARTASVVCGRHRHHRRRRPCFAISHHSTLNMQGNIADHVLVSEIGSVHKEQASPLE